MQLEQAMDQLKPLMVLVFYCMEKMKRYRLSKEGTILFPAVFLVFISCLIE